ncbi:hypothetical protein SLA2020_388210 [Shorea laevis]
MDTAQAYVWRLQNFVLGEHILNPCPENPTSVKACAITACGNFAVLGTAGGGLSDSTFNQELAEAAIWTFQKEEAVPMMGKWLELLVIQRIPS